MSYPVTSQWHTAGERLPVLAAPATVLLLPMLVAAFVDVPRSVTLAGITLMGALALAQAGVVGGALLLCRRYPVRVLVMVLPYVGFLCWAAIRTAIAGAIPGAGQNAAVYLLFGLCVLLAATVAANVPGQAFAVIDRGIRYIDLIALPLTFGSFIIYGSELSEVNWIVGPRSVSLLALAAVGWHLARWYEGHRRSGAYAVLWIIAVVLTLSRTATAAALTEVAIVMLLQLWFAPGRLVRRAPLVAAAALLGAAMLAVYGAQVRDRFFTAEFNVIEVGGVRVSSSGRSNLWPAVVESALRRPVIGQGLGSSQMVSGDIGEYLGHPHNDYLRVWHDLGLIGLVLLLTAFITWCRTLWRALRSAARHKGAHEQVVLPLAGFLGLLSLMLAASTDNALIYPFVMAPMGILVGAGLGQRPISLARSAAFSATRGLVER
jgi:O-antigen ligase